MKPGTISEIMESHKRLVETPCCEENNDQIQPVYNSLKYQLLYENQWIESNYMQGPRSWKKYTVKR